MRRGIDWPEQETKAELAKEIRYKASASSYKPSSIQESLSPLKAPCCRHHLKHLIKKMMIRARNLRGVWQHDCLNALILPDRRMEFKEKIMYYQMFTFFYSIWQHLTFSWGNYFPPRATNIKISLFSVLKITSPYEQIISTNSTIIWLFFTAFYLILQYFKHLALFLKNAFHCSFYHLKLNKSIKFKIFIKNL